MFDMNWFMGMIKQGYNPEQVMMNVLEARMKGSPMGDNLISMARSGNKAGIDHVAGTMMAQSRLDFDKEFNAFKKRYGF